MAPVGSPRQSSPDQSAVFRTRRIASLSPQWTVVYSRFRIAAECPLRPELGQYGRNALPELELWSTLAPVHIPSAVVSSAPIGIRSLLLAKVSRLGAYLTPTLLSSELPYASMPNPHDPRTQSVRPKILPRNGDHSFKHMSASSAVTYSSQQLPVITVLTLHFVIQFLSLTPSH